MEKFGEEAERNYHDSASPDQSYQRVWSLQTSKPSRKQQLKPESQCKPFVVVIGGRSPRRRRRRAWKLEMKMRNYK